MKNRILSVLLAMSVFLTPALCVQAEETDTVVAKPTEGNAITETIEENETADVDEEASLNQDIIYRRQEVYSIDFNNGVSKATDVSDDAVMTSWLPTGYSRMLFISKGSGTSEFLYGAEDISGEDGNKALKLSTPSTLTAPVNNNYLDIRTAGMNPDFPDVPSVSTGETGYVEFSFDFCTDFNSDMRLAVGRYWCADADENLTEVNKQDLMYLNTNGTLNFFGNTIKTFDTSKIKNSWHNIKIVLRADNKYQVFFDGEAVNELSNVNYGSGLSFRSVREFRLYNIGAVGVASEKYYDNFKYEIYTDVTDQYKLPQISFGDTYSPIINMNEGESYQIKFVGESLCPEKINIYIDGELSQEYYGNKCEYEYTGTLGEHLVEAELVDTVGNVSERISIKFKVAKQIEITGEFDNGKTSGEYSNAAPRIVSFKATAKKGLDIVEFYVNGEYAFASTDEETEFSFDGFGTGELKIIAVVYDKDGDSKEFLYIANVSMERLSLLWSEDYEAYVTGTTKIGDYVAITHKNGYSKAVKLDSEHGTSMALGIEQDLGSNSGEYVDFHNPKGNGHIIFETDFYVSDYPAADAYIRLTMVQESAVQNSNFMLIGSTINKGQTKLGYDTKVWNHIKIDADMINKVYSVFINDVPFVTDVSLAKEKPNFESLNYIRFYGPSKDGVPCYIAFDNTKIRAYESYSINSVTSGTGNAQINSSDKEIKIFLSENINADTLDESKVLIKNDDNIIRISNLLYSEEEKAITVKLKDVLIGGREYVIELSDTLETASGEMLGEKLSATFTVQSEQKIFILATEQATQTLTVSATATEDIQGYIIAAVWNGTKLKGEAMTPFGIAAGEVSDIELNLAFAQSADTIELYMVGSLSGFELLTDDIIRIEKP